MYQTYFDPFADMNKLKTEKGVLEAITILEKEFESGNGKSAYLLAILNGINIDSIILPKTRLKTGLSDTKAINWYKKAFPMLLSEASSGDGEAMHWIASYYQTGIPPVYVDESKRKLWVKKAREAGYIQPQY